ncbi:MAG: hypothetical protein KTR30_04875 [Saprospiraceae bacterium]|nr:hypothetical protein [Saprospiraceae bacterium]
MLTYLAYCLTSASQLATPALLISQPTLPDHDIALWLRGSVICVFLLFALCGLALYQSTQSLPVEISDKDVILTDIPDPFNKRA